MLGGVMTAVGSILPWAKVSSMFGTISKAGTEGDGMITLIVGIVVILFGTIVFIIDKYDFAVIFATLSSIGIISVAIIDLVSTSRRAAMVSGQYVTASVGEGLYIVLLGGIIIMVGVIIDAAGHSKKKPQLNLCPNCRREMTTDGPFCMFCGYQLQEN